MNGPFHRAYFSTRAAADEAAAQYRADGWSTEIELRTRLGVSVYCVTYWEVF